MKKCYLIVPAVILFAFASTAVGQEREGVGLGIGITGLLAMDEVQKELNITSAQKEKFEAVLNALGDFQNQNADERRKRFEEFAMKTAETAKTVLDKKQQQRLAELYIQRAGAISLLRADVAEKIGLDQSQKDQINKIQREYFRIDGFDSKNATPEERQKFKAETLERREKGNAALLAVLKPAQKEAYEKLQGAKFTFPPQRGPRGNNP